MSKLEDEIKQLIITSLALEDMTIDDIEAGEPLFAEGLELDSIDALELGVALKNKYQISIKDENEEEIQKHFFSVATLALFIESKQNNQVKEHG